MCMEQNQGLILLYLLTLTSRAESIVEFQASKFKISFVSLIAVLCPTVLELENLQELDKYLFAVFHFIADK